MFFKEWCWEYFFKRYWGYINEFWVWWILSDDGGGSLELCGVLVNGFVGLGKVCMRLVGFVMAMADTSLSSKLKWNKDERCRFFIIKKITTNPRLNHEKKFLPMVCINHANNHVKLWPRRKSTFWKIWTLDLQGLVEFKNGRKWGFATVPLCMQKRAKIYKKAGANEFEYRL